MIFLLYVMAFLFSLFLIFIFYPYTFYINGNNKRFVFTADLLLLDLFIKENRGKSLIYIKLFGLLRINIKKDFRKKYSPNYERIYFVVSFLFKHIRSFFNIINIKKAGVIITAGSGEYYYLSQICVFSILINNLLKDGYFIKITPDFCKERFDWKGIFHTDLYLWKIIWFFIKFLIHPATYSGIYEYYRYYRSNLKKVSEE